ncbi:MAG: 4'-phosphopantetheinyl transferase superfamily protein [Bacteroidales bacterium]|jgi:4'-phosphopantetheinyl transferase EntD|nr:4'-phosphopantetheinyl transferase superfamily protein [Bacteroidales bacterium]
MPLYLTEEIKNVGLFSIWKLTENEEELLQLITLSQEGKHHFATLKNKKRKKEWLTNRILLNHLLGKDFSIDYLSNGKPILKEPSFFLSISHSNDFVVVFISRHKETGVDIEKIKENIASLKHKFLLPEELQSLNTSNPFLLHVYWGAKEAMYKMYSSYHPLFTEHLSLSDVDCQKGTATGKIMKEDCHKTVNIIFKQIEDNLLVCCFEN